jgi:hypothetical protein
MMRHLSRIYWLVAVAALILVGGCADDLDDGPVAPDKAAIGGGLDADSLVDTHILNGESDDYFVDDPRVYPYYIVHHGPAAGEYAFTAGDTVPDGAYVVLKARASTDEPGPKGLNIQGHFTALGYYLGDAPYQFATTYSPLLKSVWADPAAGVAADTLGFEVGPFAYDVAMRGAVRLSGAEVHRDPSPAELSFQGNYPPCVQSVAFANRYLPPAADGAAADCWQGSLDDVAELAIYPTMDIRYDPMGDAAVMVQESPFTIMFIQPETGQVSLDVPDDPESWISVFAEVYSTVAYLNGRDHLQEMPPADRLQERVKAWRYQIDHAADPDNVLREGPGEDDLARAFGVSLPDNDPDPMTSDAFITDEGSWGLRVRVAVPFLLMVGGPQMYWNNLLVSCGAPEQPADPADLPAWQADPAVQLAYRVWQLSLLALGDGSLSVIAGDQPACEDNHERGMYHYYHGTRIPEVHGRRCEPGVYDDPAADIIEQGNLDLAPYAAWSNGGQAVVKPLHITAHALDGDGFDGGDPPGWIAGREARRDRSLARR